MNPKISIVLAGQTVLFSKSLVALLHTHSQFQVIAEASDGRQLLEHLKHNSVDVVIMDPTLKVINSKAALEIIHQRFPDVKVIVLSSHIDMKEQSDFMASGANSYLRKSCDEQTLFNAILEVKSDGIFLDRSTSIALLDTVLKKKNQNSAPFIVNFNDREKDIMKKICDGKTNKEIAHGMHLSPSTIDFYRTKIYGKTKCNNATGLLKYALKNGLVELT